MKFSKILCKDLKVMYKEVCQVLRRYLYRYGRYSRKTKRGIGSDPSPQAVAGKLSIECALVLYENRLPLCHSIEEKSL